MTMHAFVMNYSYLLSTVAYIAVVLMLGRFTLPREQFRLMHLTGLTSAPVGVLCFFLEGNYWTPPRLGGLRIGIEDILIGYAVGMLPWYLVAVVWRRRLQVRFHWPAVLRRYVVAGAGCDLTYLVTVWVGMDPMTGMLITYGLGAVALWLFRRGNWPLAATGVLQFPVVWFCVVAFTFWLFPEFIFKFNLAGNWGRPVFGVPVGEIAWAFTFGVFWPLFTAVIFNVEIERQPVAGQA
ncbi:MAG: hypothetical protein ABSB22_01970 [Thermodesulfobacteriota bacterium]|jgi:hypothetical protein